MAWAGPPGVRSLGWLPQPGLTSAPGPVPLLGAAAWEVEVSLREGLCCLLQGDIALRGGRGLTCVP